MSELRLPVVAGSTERSIVRGGAAGARVRALKDRAVRWLVWCGGIGVIAALLLIFFYLLTQVLPLFGGAELRQRATFTIPGSGQATLLLAVDDHAEIGMRLDAGGEVVFFDLRDGAIRQRTPLPLAGQALASVQEMSAETGSVAVQLADGSVLPFQHRYQLSYPEGRRRITPQLRYPYDAAPLPFMEAAARSFAARETPEALLLAGADADNGVHLRRYQRSAAGTVTLAAEHRIAVKIQADLLLLDPALRWLYVIDRQAGKLAFYGLDAAQPPTLLGTYATAARVQHAAYLAGGHSIILAQADGLVSQWFPARNASGKPYLARVRDFDLPRDRQVTAIGPELRRRGFAVGDSVGQVSLFHATAGRLLERHQVADGPLQWLRFDARAQYLAVLDAHGQLSGFEVRNPHPEISLQALWGKVWYESYDEAQWLWHSSSTAADFEPKFSMTPLMFGTLKAAFYAMLFAIPIALLGAMFTAQFMAPDVRRVVKPTIEVLAALPSVVLGFIAGLWLAPFVETQLGGMFLLLLLLPLCIPAFGYLCLNLPASLRPRAGWEAVLLLPVIVLVVWLSFVLAPPLERLLFDGSLRDWLDRVLGIGYEQRNALVVGIAMGVAVIPSIFSIAEDAIFAVPRSLTVGSLALGATPWQTLIGVVLPTASPGIFSALMIGGGRAVGETMIVLMATGNTPLTDFSLFQGLRSFAANIAVELPESEVGSTHFRLLFLAGLVLFLFTFLLNTLAEVVRQRLRSRYSRI